MKRFLKKKWLGIPLGVIVAVVLISGVALAATWGVTALTSTGTITVEEVYVPDYSYTIDSGETDPLELAFGATVVDTDAPVSIDATFNIENTGDQAINGFDIVFAGEPSFLTIVEDYSVAVPVGETVGVTVTLSGTAPGTAEVIDLVGMTATLTPN